MTGTTASFDKQLAIDTIRTLSIDGVQQANSGPLDNSAIVRLFERVIDESRSLERILTKGK